MGKVLTSRSVGSPDFKMMDIISIASVASSVDSHFTEILIKDASEQENLTGLLTNKGIIRGVSINSIQPLDFLLEFYSKDTFTDSDLDVDTFIGGIRLNIPTLGKAVRGANIEPLVGEPKWKLEAAFPVVPQWRIGFSPVIIENGSYIVYMVDWGSGTGNFYRYNLSNRTYTTLISPTYDFQNCPPTLALSPDGTKLAMISDRNGYGSYPTGRRIEIYNIAGNTWKASAQTPAITGQVGHLTSIVWQDEDILWAWVRRGTTSTGKCMRYTISTDAWGQWTTLFTPGSTWFGTTAAMKGDNTQVYGICRNAVNVEAFSRYVIASDSYATKGLSVDVGQLLMYDKDKLWYHAVSDYRQGYIDTELNTENNNIFVANPNRSVIYPTMGGIKDDLSLIVVHALSSSPYVMSLEMPTSYYLNIKGINLPYVDLDGTKEFHMILKNLSPTAKNAGSKGKIKITVFYEPAS